MPRVQIVDTDISVELRVNETILAGLFRAGYGYRVGCRRGGCGICKVDLVDGAVEYSQPISESVLSVTEREAGSCLSCRAVPVEDVLIRLREGANLRNLVPFLVGLKSDYSNRERGQ